MAVSFDELLEFLIDQVAIRGESGTSVEEIRKLTENFYRSSRDDHGDSSSSSPFNARNNPAQALVDDHLIGKIWSWLTRNPEIRVEGRKQKNENVHQKAHEPISASTTTSAQPVYHDVDAPSQQAHPTGTSSSVLPDRDAVLVAAENMMWQALTGHGVDITRVKPMEFTLLSFIGAAGPNGIPQTQLIAQSGQDKRSLPHRTDMLAERGYITKKSWRVKGCNTSLLTLKRYDKVVEETEDTFDPINATPKEVYEYTFPPGRPCVLDRLVKVLVAILGKVDLMTAKKLRIRIGVSAHKLSARNLFIFLFRLELLGIIQRVGIPSVTGNTIILHSVKLLMKPDEATVQRFVAWTGKDEEELIQARRNAGESLSDMIEPENGMGPIEPATETAEPEDENEEVDVVPPSTRMLAQWTPNKPITNLFFDVLNAAGPEGLSTMDFNLQSMGPCYKRPIEHVLGHLTDIWHKSQPPHLRHLAIVRDTKTENKSLHYHYRTYGNFVQAVDRGETSWDAIGWSPHKEKLKAKDAPDEWGFTNVPASSFHARSGAATASEARKAFRFDHHSRSFLADFLSMKPATRRPQLVQISGTTPAPRRDSATGNKPLGRPRKYAKGLEPYKSGTFYKNKETRQFEAKSLQQAKRMALAELAEADRYILDPPKRIGRPPKANKELTKPRRRNLIQPVPEGVLEFGEPPADMQIALYETILNFGEGAENITAGASMAGMKRAASGQPEGEPAAKRQETDIEQHKQQLQTRLNDRANVLKQELITLSRPGLYIAPPGSQPTNLSKDDSLIVVTKSARLRHFAWFEPSLDVPKLARGAKLPAPSAASRKQKTDPDMEVDNDKAEIGTPERAPKRRRTTKMATFAVEHATPPPVYMDTPQPVTDVPDGVAMPPMQLGVDKASRAATTSEPSYIDQLPAWSHVDTSHNAQTVNHLASSNIGLHSTNSARRSHDVAFQMHGIARDDSVIGQVTCTQTEANDGQSRLLQHTVHVSDSIAVDQVSQSEPRLGHGASDVVQPELTEQCSANSLSTQSAQQPAAPQRSKYTPFVVQQAVPQAQPIHESIMETSNNFLRHSESTQSLLPGVTMIDEQDPQKPARKPPKRPYQKKVGVRLAAGGMVGYNRNQRLLKLVGQAGGAYPGDREMYYAFATDAAKYEAEVTVDWHTIKRSLKQLTDSGKLVKITFVFPDKNGVTAKKHIVLLPGIKADSDEVRSLQRRMVAAYPHYHFPEGVDIDQDQRNRLMERRGLDTSDVQVKTILERENIMPAQASVLARARVDNEPAWKQWAKAEKVGGDLAKIVRDVVAPFADSDEEAFGEEPDEDQVGMQVQFQLGTYTHQPAAVPQKGLAPGAKYASRTAWFRKQKERSDQARLDRERRERVNLERQEKERLVRVRKQKEDAAKKQREFLELLKHKQQQERLKATSTAISRKPDIDLSNISLQFARDIGLLDMTAEEVERSQQEYFLEEHEDSGFVSSTISSTLASSARPTTAQKPRVCTSIAGMKHQASPIIFLQRAPAVTMNPSAWLWPFGKRKPGRQPVKVAVQSLTDPDQIPHHTTGTFSTEFFFCRSTKPALKINVNSHRDWEKKIPGSLEEIIEQRRGFSTASTAARASISFNDQIDQVALWEERNADLINEMSLVNPRFINFTVPEDVPADRGTTPELIGTPYHGRPVHASALNAAQQSTDPSTPFKKPNLPQNSGRKVGRPGKKGYQKHANLRQEEHQRLLASVVAVRSLLGGVEQQINWSIVQSLLPDHDPSMLLNHWKTTIQTHVLHIARFQKEFENAFAQAYEKRLVPSINFGDPAKYDWDGLLVWIMQNLHVPADNLDSVLPGKRDILDDFFKTHDDPMPEEHLWDDYFKELSTFLKRTEIINSVSFDHALQPVVPANSTDAQTCARSLLRANAFVPEGGYDSVAARERIESSYSEPEVDIALASLMSSGVLLAKNKGRLMPGRNYYIGDRYFQHIKRNALDVSALQAACMAKIHLDDMILNPAGPGFYTVDYTASNGEIMLLIELLTQGRLDLHLDVPPTTYDPDVKCLDPVTGARHLSIWGFTVAEGHYKSTKMDRDNLTFRVNAYPTASYVPGVPLQNPLPPPPAPLVVDGKTRFPLWYDIHDRLLPDIWEGFVAMVLGALVLRPGCGIRYITESMGRKMVEEWDVQIAIEWLMGVGVVEGSREDGYAVKEWWWAVFGCGAGV